MVSVLASSAINSGLELHSSKKKTLIFISIASPISMQ